MRLQAFLVCSSLLACRFPILSKDTGQDSSPGAAQCSAEVEIPYDGIDQDCDGADLTDVDGDGSEAASVDGGDCDDSDPTVSPAASEVCDDLDNDCDGLVDDGVAGTFHADVDGDAFGDEASAVTACSPPLGFISDATDCDDTRPTVHPGAPEVCDDLDDDCDGSIDEGAGPTIYADTDSDGYGDATTGTRACDDPMGWVTNATDCDDARSAIHPEADEICDGADNDCDGSVDEGNASDASTWYADMDGDGYGDPGRSLVACLPPAAHASNATDCDDTDASVNPAAPEICDDLDDDCDGFVDDDDTDVTGTTAWYADVDGDGYGDGATFAIACRIPADHVSDASDCDDADATQNPAASEICDGTDNDCDGQTDGADSDGGDCPTAMDDDGTICSSLMGTDDGLVPRWTGNCDSSLGFSTHGTHCYYPVAVETTWPIARASCRAAGGYLVTIQDASEDAFVQGLNERPYLGGCDADTEGAWTWITGEEWAFTTWSAGEPNNYTSGEDCLEDYPGSLWNDIWCEYHSFGSGYVCEFEASAGGDTGGGDDTGNHPDTGETGGGSSGVPLLLGRIPLAGASQVAVDSVGSRLHVPAYHGGSFTDVIDTDDWTRVGTFGTLNDPNAVMVDPLNDHVFVGNCASGALTIVHRVSLAPVATVRGFSCPHHMLLEESTNRVFVMNHNSGVVDVMDGTRLTITDSLTLGYGLRQSALADGVLFVVESSGTVHKIDTASFAVTAQVNLPSQLYGSAYVPSFDRLYVSGFDAGVVYVLEASSLTLLTTLPISGPYQMAVDQDSGTVAVPGYGDGDLHFLDAASDSFVNSVTVCTSATDVALDPLTHRWYVTCFSQNEVAVVEYDP